MGLCVWNMLENLSKNLNLLMSKRRVTTNMLARQTGIPASTIKKMRARASTNPTIATLVPIANFFSVSLEILVHGNPTYKPVDEVGVLPVISWEDAIKWPITHYNSMASCIASEDTFGQNAFALRVETQDWTTFSMGSLLLIDPSVQPDHGDFVVIYKTDQLKPTLKQLYLEDESVWLKSVAITNNIIRLTSEYRILGVVVEYRNQLKQQKILSKYPAIMEPAL